MKDELSKHLLNNKIRIDSELNESLFDISELRESIINLCKRMNIGVDLKENSIKDQYTFTFKKTTFFEFQKFLLELRNINRAFDALEDELIGNKITYNVRYT